MTAARFAFSLGLMALVACVPALGQEELGPLAGGLDAQLREGWKGGSQDGWYVLRNDTLQGSEQTLVVNAGPAPAAGRHVSVNVSLNSDIPEAAIGIMARSATGNDVCLMEITANAAANLFCVIGDENKSIANVAGAARMDGTDTIEMIEVPGSAQFLVNGSVIGEVTYTSALGGELGVMAYERGVFGVADFAITDLQATQATGSGLPPKGGAGQPAAQTEAPAGEAPSDNAARINAIMGPLGETIFSAEDKDGWDLFLEGEWIVLVNGETASSEIYYTLPAGQVASGDRVTSVDVGILPPQGRDAADFPKSAAGILIESTDGKQSCIGEITGAKDALVLCFGEDGKATEMGRLDGAVTGDGQDKLQFIERPNGGTFQLNGQVIADLENHPALGGDIGILAYERGEFYFGGFTITSAASADTTTATGAGGQGGPMPMFGNDNVRLIGVYLGLSNGIFMHEFGHALIGELQVPSTGPEEDAVDIFSALRVVEPTMYPSGDAEIDAIGREVAIYSALPWYYGGLLSEQSGQEMPWQDEHTADLKRFRNTFCVIYGGNPDLYGNVAADVGLDERTLSRCSDEFNKQNRAWRTILAPHTRVGTWHPEGLLPADAPGAKINVVFEPSQTRVGQFIADTFAEGLTGFAKDLADTYALPRDLTVTYRDCGELNAWYDPSEGSITMCYDLIENLAVMISDVEMGTSGGVEVGAAPQLGSTKSKSSASNTAATAAPSGLAAFDELADLGVPVTNVLFPAPYRGPTPAGHTKAQMMNTEQLAILLGNEEPALVIDTRGQTEIIPGSYSITDAGQDGSITDSFQSVVDRFLTDETKGNKSLPIIFYGDGMQDRSAYNAALRAAALGWNAFWYRGGTEAWKANDLPLVTQE